jgi:hypothetical protein
MKTRSKYLLIGTGLFLLISFATIRIIESHQNPARVAFMLNIPEPPRSIHVIGCESGNITDVIITCAIEIDPSEFPLLLVGHSYNEYPESGTSYTVGVPKVGPEFPVTTQYISYPAEFQHGGAVRIFTNKEKNRAVVDLYVE